MKRITGNIVVKIALVAFSFFCVFTIITLQFQKNDLMAQIDDQREALVVAEENRDALQRECDEPFDDEYIIRYAKEKLNLREPDEMVFYNGN